MANLKLSDEKNVEFNTGEFFDLAIMMPEHLSRYFLLEQSNGPIDPNLQRMIEFMKEKGIKNQKVLDVFKVVDRKYFINNNLELNRDNI